MRDASLFVHRWGQGPGLVALHGFSLDGRMFARFAQALGRTLVAPDLPGHGQSAERAPDWAETAAAVAATLEREGDGALLGYSQGGRVALQVALDRPDLVRRLIVVSSGSGIADPVAREGRRAADAALAERIERGGVAAFVDAWLEQPLIRPRLTPELAAANRALRLEQSAAGLAAALRGLGQGVMPALGERLGELSCEVLWVAGERDATYRALAEPLAAACPRGRALLLPGGHNLVAECPHALAEACR